MTPTKDRDIVRRCIFRPYGKNLGPVFRLTIWDTHKTTDNGKCCLGYQLKMDKEILFEGEDLGNSPLHAVDSDATVSSLMGFLTLHPGDTDKEYFDKYTPAQLDYCSEHAEFLSCEVMNRFGEH